jgi:hypothetical protein
LALIDRLGPPPEIERPKAFGARVGAFLDE